MYNIFKLILLALFIPTACCTAQTKFKALVVNDWLQAGSLTISGGANIVGELLEDAAINANQISTPSNPAAGRNKLYFKSDDKLYKLTSGGAESEVGAAGANQFLSNLTDPTAVSETLYMAASKSVRVPNNISFLGRNVGDTADLNLIAANSSNDVHVGNNTSQIVRFGGAGTTVLIPNSGGELGSPTAPWLAKTSNIWGIGSAAIQWELNGGSIATPSSGSVFGTIKSNAGTGFTIFSVSQAGNTGPLSNETGNSSSFASGDIKRQTGTANTTSGNIIDRTGTAGTVRGKHLSDTRLLDVTSAAVFVKVTADPCADTSAFPEGALFYNDTSDYYCFCDGAGADQQMHSPATACF